MTLTLKQGFAIGALVATIVSSPLASALTMNFDNTSGIYTGSDGTIGVVTPSELNITYRTNNGGGIGVGTGTGTSARVESGEFLDIVFNRRVLIDQIRLAEWSNPTFFGIFVQDRAQYLYPENPTLANSEIYTRADGVSSSVGRFDLGGVSVDGIRVSNPRTGAWTLQSITYSETPVPATLGLVGLALLGLGMVKRKKA